MQEQYILTVMPSRKKIRRDNGGKAVGAYLKTLREALDFSPTQIAAAIDTEPTQIWRIETWKADIGSSYVFGYLNVVNGRGDDIALLFNNPDATSEDGAALARQLLKLRNK